MLSFENFSFSYGSSDKKALCDINISFKTGTLSVVTGLSSSGKSTLLAAAAGIVPCCIKGRQSGHIFMDKTDISGVSPAKRARYIGYIGEDIDSQMVCVKVEDEIRFGLENFGYEKHIIEDRTENALKLLDIEDLRNRTIASLSGGQKQRTAIAAMTALMPPVLLLDNPAGALDPRGADELYALLSKLARGGITIITAEERSELFAPYADAIVLLEEGKLRAKGTPHEMYGKLAACKDFSYLDIMPKTVRFALELSRLTEKDAGTALTIDKACGMAEVFLSC